MFLSEKIVIQYLVYHIFIFFASGYPFDFCALRSDWIQAKHKAILSCHLPEKIAVFASLFVLRRMPAIPQSYAFGAVCNPCK